MKISKKLFVALALFGLSAGAVNAQSGYLSGVGNSVYGFNCGFDNCVGFSGSYNLTTMQWVNEAPLVNQKFTYAIDVTNPTVLAWLAAVPNRTLALSDFRSGINENVNHNDIRLENVCGNIYAVDMVIIQLFPSINFSLLNGNNNYCHFELTGASTTGSTWDWNRFGYGNFWVTWAYGANAAHISKDGINGIATPGTCNNNPVAQTWNIGSPTASSVTATVSGSGSNLTLIISGTGGMKDFAGVDFSNNTTAPWNSIKANIKTLVINEGVTSIGNFAFCYCSGLTGTLAIPNSVTTIGNYAFYNCSGLTEITIPNSITSIGERAFYGCRGLTTVNFNATNCTTMGSSGYPIFQNCTNLTTLMRIFL